MQIKTTASFVVLLLATAALRLRRRWRRWRRWRRRQFITFQPPPPILPDCIIYDLDCIIYDRYISQGLSHEQAAERTRTLSIRMINADAAYDRGWTGDGVTIGFYEYAIDEFPPGTKRKRW